MTSKVNQAKDVEQKNALNSWARGGFIGSVIAGTGFGKSRVGVIATDKTLSATTDGRAIVLVPTVQLQEQFEEEFLKWGCDEAAAKTEFVCYQSAYKLKGNHYTIVVCDEIHLGLSEQYRKFFENNTFDRLLCMTATPPEEIEYKELLFEMAPLNYEISLDECVEKGLVAPYEVVCQPLELTEKERAAYKKANNQFIYAKMMLGQFNAFDQAKYIMGAGSATASREDKAAAAMFYKAIRARKKVVDHASAKIAALGYLVDEHDGKTLVFGGSNDFTDALGNSLGELASIYHSKISKKNREKALEDFKTGQTPVLCSTKALNQGLDVEDATLAVICGLTSKSLTMIQRVGRVIRFKEDKRGKIVCLYVKDSQEEKWLKSSVKNLGNVVWLEA
tara:strand:- start:12594 stop:13766 length:1173 start_codon:yes stop_codon:yes gene_type:complete